MVSRKHTHHTTKKEIIMRNKIKEVLNHLIARVLNKPFVDVAKLHNINKNGVLAFF